MAIQLEQHLKHIKSLPLFDQLEEKDLADMLRHQIIRLMSFEPGEVIITEKSFDRKIFLTLKGSVKITKDVFSDDCRQCKEIKTIEGGGHLLGEVTAFSGKPRTASVLAVRRTACVMINVGLLMSTSSRLLERVTAKFYPGLFAILCKRLDETNDFLVAARQKCEDLEKKLKEANLQKTEMRQEFQKTLQNKNRMIKQLEERLE